VADRYHTVLLLGAPGAGKGTQGKMLGAIPGFFHFSTGDMFRNLDPASELGKTFLNYSTRGELVPDEITVRHWKNCMHERAREGKYTPGRDLLILDGIPRNVPQTELMDEHINVLGAIVLAAADPEKMLQRLRGRALKEGRPDDAKEEVVRRRLDIYAAETEPVLAHYPKQLVHRIDAIGTPARVLHRVLSVLAPIQETNFPNALC
jgi:adenylate kinase